MEAEIQVIENFIQLIKTQPNIFYENDRNELEAIITPLSNDDVEGLADEIDDWCTSHPVIDDALNVLLASKPIREMGIGGASPNDKTKVEDDKNQGETQDNEIRKSSPPETKKPNTGHLGVGGTFPTPEAKAEYEKNLKEELLNALRNSSPPETKKPNTSKG
mgnify:CR=1 FL=1